MSSRLERVFWRAVWCSVGWNCHGLLDYFADRLGDTTGRKRS